MRNISCRNVEQLLSHNSINELTEDERSFLATHLNSCARCREYQQMLKTIDRSLQIEEDANLIPDPAIYRTLWQRFKSTRQTKSKDVFSYVWEWVTDIISYRIPVYQVVLVAVFILLTFWGVYKLPSSLNLDSEKIPTYSRIELPDADQLSIMQVIEIINQQKIGRNVTEDTLLIRYIVTSM